MAFEKLPRVKLANLPTPVEPLPRFSEAIGGGPQIYIKRDDETGLATGGNKARKLEFLLADALEKRADVVITTGATISNHARMTVAGARKLGLDCTLILFGEESDEYEGNLFLDELFGADIRIYPPAASPEERPQYTERVFQEVIDDLKDKGRTPYVIPTGGATALGEVGYVYAVKEIQDQARAMGIQFDYIFVAKGSGGTMAGLVLGTKYFQTDMQVIGIGVSPKEGTPFDEDWVAQLVNQTAELLETDIRVSPEELSIYWDYGGEGYGIPTPEGAKMIQLLAQTEGILLEPVYTSKTMAGLVDLVQKGTLTKDHTVLFVHTGGLPCLLQDAARLRKMLSDQT